MYSAREVEQVRRMRALCESGVPAAEAAKSVLAEDDASVFPNGQAAALPPLEASLHAILDAVSRFDDHALEYELRKLMFMGSTAALVERVLTPALRQIGELWHGGNLSIAQEHLASQRLGTLLRDLLRLAPGADSDTGVLLACFADDDHELGLLTTAVRLSEWGLRPLFLGARTPPAAVRSAVLALSPALVALSVTISPSPARVKELVAGYADACGALPWVVGGAAIEAVADAVRLHGGRVASDDAEGLRETATAAIVRARASRGFKARP